jgi:DNA-directed RNA polymerase specialized sigma24 family protein
MRLEALGRLLEKYESPLKSYLRAATSRFQVGEDWVQDCFQSFVEKKIMKRQIIEEADRSRGRFRDLLKTSLYRFALDELRKKWRHPLEPIAPDSSENPIEPPPEPPPQPGGDMEWAYEVLTQSLNSLRNGFEKKGQCVHMTVFARRRLPVLLGDAEIESLDETVGYIGASLGEKISRDEVSNRQKTTERALREHLITVLSDYCGSEEEILEELEHVCNSLVAANQDAGYDHIRRNIRNNFR